MFAAVISKWFTSILMIGFLLTSPWTGGERGSTPMVDTSINAVPIIEEIHPSIVRTGSPSSLVFIVGHNFGNIYNTRVRFRDTNIDQLFIPDMVSPEELALIVDGSFLISPITYTVTVVKCLPLIPPSPPD